MPAALRILYLTTEIPYPLTSGFLRHYHFLRALSRRHHITYMSLTKKPAIAAETWEALAVFSSKIAVFGVPSPQEPWILRKIGALPVLGKKYQGALRIRWAAQELQRAVAELVRREHFDLILFSGKNTFPAIAGLEGLPIVADCCDATSSRVRGEMQFAGLARKLWLLLRYLEVKRIERRLVRKTPYLAFASNRDRMIMLNGVEAGEIIPQAVDVDYWRRGTTPREHETLVFTGVMNYPPNHDAALWLLDHVLPLVRQQFPGVTLILAGRDPLPALQTAARRHSNVIVTGFVEDLRPYLARAAVYVAPIRFASGVQNKILEAMAMEVPVVTTPVVAEGLRLQRQSELPLRVAEGAQSFAAAVVDLLHHPEAGARLAMQGRAFVEQHFIWARNVEKLEKMCFDAAGRRRCSRPAVRVKPARVQGMRQSS